MQMLDQQYYNFIQTNEDLKDRWLLLQNLALRGIRRRILDMLAIDAGQRILDLGCGFGVTTLDLAAQKPVKIEAVDVDAAKIEAANTIYQSIFNTMGPFPGDVAFNVDDANELSLEDESHDWVISQHVFQHLQQPEQVLAEIYRVLKPGGRVCIVDVDHGLSVSYPEQPALRQLSQLLVQVQENNGGDRYVGRKLPYLLHNAGFTVESTVPVVQAEFLSLSEKQQMLHGIAEHFTEFRSQVVEAGMVEQQEFDQLIEDFLGQPLHHTFEVDMQFVVSAQKPLA